MDNSETGYLQDKLVEHDFKSTFTPQVQRQLDKSATRQILQQIAHRGINQPFVMKLTTEVDDRRKPKLANAIINFRQHEGNTIRIVHQSTVHFVDENEVQSRKVGIQMRNCMKQCPQCVDDLMSD